MTSGSRWQRVWEALDARLALHNFLYEVPAHADTLPYLLGMATLAGLAVLIATGIYLGQFYAPDPGAANESIRLIITQVAGGAVIRGIHVWASHLTLIVLILHVVRVYVTGAYRFPREANWMVGVALLGTMLAFVFTGTVLRWDQEALEALEHNLALAQLLGVFGGWFSPAFSIHIPLLTRLYISHVSLLPLLLVILLTAHLYLIRQHGISAPPGGSRCPQAHHTFAQHLKGGAGYGLMLLGLSLLLAVLRPPGEGAAPVPGIEVTKPPWVFLPAYGLENWFGIPGLLWGVIALFGWLFAIPILDRSTIPGWAGRRRAIAVGVLVGLVIAGLGVSAWLSHPVAHLH